MALYALSPGAMRVMGKGQQQHDDFGTDLSMGADLTVRPAAKTHRNPETIAWTPDCSMVQPFSQTPEAKNSMVMNIQNAQRVYSAAIRFHAFG
mmetsp:Transcript_33787/g.71037  ORF Transcript_33787/g.71037 Transcript_33787/m.71037 type:complete len:93 (+) Transcript_33787:344-622(+)